MTRDDAASRLATDHRFRLWSARRSGLILIVAAGCFFAAIAWAGHELRLHPVTSAWVAEQATASGWRLEDKQGAPLAPISFERAVWAGVAGDEAARKTPAIVREQAALYLRRLPADAREQAADPDGQDSAATQRLEIHLIEARTSLWGLLWRELRPTARRTGAVPEAEPGA